MSATAERSRQSPARQLVEQVREHPLVQRLESPLTTYYVLLGATGLLLLIGLVMVLSVTMVTKPSAGQSTFSAFLNQLLFAAIGVAVAGVASRITPQWFRRLGVPMLLGACALELLVLFTSLGLRINGNRNWLHVGSLTFQPSELIKLALVVIGATVLANKRKQLGALGQVVLPYLFPVVTVSVGLVLLGHDLGTSLVILLIVSAVLFVAGVPGRYFLMAGGLVALVALLSVVTSGNRTERISNWLSGSCTDPNGACGQSVHGVYALADGGWWGVGLGGSIEKWGWLPEAKNDFIFAVIGEELGLPGTLIVLVLFAMVGWACYRLIARSRDQFVRIATGGVMAWILAQAVINIGSVIGLLPVIGVPLPFVSAGGSALVTTLLAVGMLLSFARNEPGVKEALSARTGAVRRSLAVMPGRRPAATARAGQSRKPGRARPTAGRGGKAGA